MAIALIAGGDEGLHLSIGRERPGRYSSGPREVAEGIVVHVHPTSTRWPGSAGPMVSGWPIRKLIRDDNINLKKRTMIKEYRPETGP
jgi:hypothetical protein